MPDNTSVYFGDSRWIARLDIPPVIISARNSWQGQHGDERYLLPNLWSFHMYRYDAELVLDNDAYPIHYGAVSIVPPNVPIHYRYTHTCEHFFLHFSLEQALDIHNPVHFPVMFDWGEDFEDEYQRIMDAASRSFTSSYRLRAYFWDLLCRIVNRFPDHPIDDQRNMHPVIRIAQILIEHRLSQTIRITDIASESGVTPGYLVKLFQIYCGTTVVEYIRRRRLYHAAHLISSTTMPIKAIATTVGIPDLHRFNKEIHRGFLCSPRQMREYAERKATIETSNPPE